MNPNSRRFTSLRWKDVLYGYSQGIFPMGDGKKYISWYEASPRAIIDLAKPLIIPRSLRQVIKKEIFTVKTDSSFKKVISACALRPDTWINELIIRAYTELYELGFAHSVEAWKDGELAGGLYGVALRGAFFGESMFHTFSNASKICVVRLFEILKENKFKLFDIQMMTSHFRNFGAVNITRDEYHRRLKRAMSAECKFK